MNLVEFAENISPIALTEFQKVFLADYEKVRNDDGTVFVIFPRMQGRGIMCNIIEQWERDRNGNN